jgi:DMSO reductase family type II enzyme chaperone
MQHQEDQHSQWAAESNQPRRSVFGNYHPAASCSSPSEAETQVAAAAKPNQGALGPDAPRHAGLQATIDSAVGRAFLFQFLSRAFEDPTSETWSWLTNSGTHAALLSAAGVIENGSLNLEKLVMAVTARLRPDHLERFQMAYVSAFGHAARGDCPLNEIEYGDLKADPLFQPHRLADLAAFYRAFGLEIADAAGERPDHIGMELEFMSVLAAKEAYALEYQLDVDLPAICRDAQKKFLREHLGRWSPAFARRLARVAADEALASLAEFLRGFIATECARFGLTPGSEDLLLRPVDETAESLCASCGLQTHPPGATGTGARS